VTTVDVVVPCYNYSRYLRACVHSVLAQQGVDVRVLIIDDASSDKTPDVGSELASADQRVQFRRHEVNRGHIATYNEGLLGWSTADYCVLLSADDMLAPGSLRRATHIMNADPSIGMVYGRPFYFHDEAVLSRISSRERGCTRWSGAEWLEGRCRAGHNVIASPEVVVRGSVQRAVGGYCKDLPHVADFEMWLRIAAVSDIAYVRGVPQAFYRRHASSMTSHRTQLIDLNERRNAFETFFKHYRDRIVGAEILRSLADRALAREALWAACRAYDHNQVEQRLASELIAFALETCPQATSLPEYAALRRRQRLGPVVCKRTQVFAVPAMARRMRKWLWWRLWERRGI
jgi:glycosyltransferase involved in cell wall biosynthesis